MSQISADEIAFLVKNYLKAFPSSYEVFLKESQHLTRNIRLPSHKDVKSLNVILNEYVNLKRNENQDHVLNIHNSTNKNTKTSNLTSNELNSIHKKLDLLTSKIENLEKK